MAKGKVNPHIQKKNIKSTKITQNLLLSASIDIDPSPESTNTCTHDFHTKIIDTKYFSHTYSLTTTKMESFQPIIGADTTTSF